MLERGTRCSARGRGQGARVKSGADGMWKRKERTRRGGSFP